MAKKKPIIVRVCFIVLFVIFLPLIIIEFIAKKLVSFYKKKKFNAKTYGASEFLENCDIEKVDIMEGFEFEKFLKVLFFYKGYKVEETKRTGDFGADLILKKDGIKTVVQAKRYNNNVGAKAIQEIYSALAHYKADEMMVVTNARFTNQAEQMAKEQNVELVDRGELVSLIEEVKQIILDLGVQKDELAKNREFSSFEENFKYRI